MQRAGEPADFLGELGARAIGSAPRFVLDGFRALRTVLLQTVDRIDGRMTPDRVSELPPLWLLRHTGPIGVVSSAAIALKKIIRDYGFLVWARRVLDLGCGPGVLAVYLQPDFAPGTEYVGVDVHRPSIDWCQKRFASDARFRFEVANVASPYGVGRVDAASYRLPIDDDWSSLTIAKSLFTHLNERTARYYLNEIHRTLVPGGVAVLSVFLFEKAGRVDLRRSPLFPFPMRQSPIRWRWRAQPEAGVAYERAYFFKMISEAGLVLSEMNPGFWPGDGERIAGQDILFLARSS